MRENGPILQLVDGGETTPAQTHGATWLLENYHGYDIGARELKIIRDKIKARFKISGVMVAKAIGRQNDIEYVSRLCSTTDTKLRGQAANAVIVLDAYDQLIREHDPNINIDVFLKAALGEPQYNYKLISDITARKAFFKTASGGEINFYFPPDHEVVIIENHGETRIFTRAREPDEI